MKFGFRREKTKVNAEQTTAGQQVDPNTLREAIRSTAAATTPAQNPATAYTIQHEINKNDSNIPDGTKQVAILILPESHNVMDFWTLYQSIQKSGVPSHVGVFSRTNGVWLEEQLSE